MVRGDLAMVMCVCNYYRQPRPSSVFTVREYGTGTMRFDKINRKDYL